MPVSLKQRRSIATTLPRSTACMPSTSPASSRQSERPRGSLATAGVSSRCRPPRQRGSALRGWPTTRPPKRRVAGYIKGAARDLGPKQITVNALGIGPVGTEMNPDSGPFAEWLRSATALGRYAGQRRSPQLSRSSLPRRQALSQVRCSQSMAASVLDKFSDRIGAEQIHLA